MYDVIVIGAGPSGMMASIIAASKGNNVLLIEKNNRVGKKLELTGGTRCNLTNLKEINHFIKEIPVNNKMLLSALTKFGPNDIYSYFEKLGVSLKVEDNNRVFPISNNAKTIIDVLYKELNKYKVAIHLNEYVEKIEIKENYKLVATNKNIYKTKKVIIATGGFTYPQTGSTGDGYKFASLLGHEIVDVYPAETYVISKEALPLAGIDLENVVIKFNNKEIDGAILFTHKGLSGPSIFKISGEVYQQLKNNKYVTIVIDLIPNYNIDQLLIELGKYNQKKEIGNFIKQFLPKRLVDYIINTHELNDIIGNISRIKRIELLNIFKNFNVIIKGTGSIEESFVTGGGINVKSINPKTMESIVVKGIYFVGEILDIHGNIGGYNITIALSTGYVAGDSI